MTDCPNGLMRDQLPEYVHGRLSAADAAQVDAHLDGCAECRAEVALLGQARAALSLGVPRIDVASIVAALPMPRVAARRAPRRVARRFPLVGTWQFAAAATLVLAIGSGIVWRQAPDRGGWQLADSSRIAAVAETTASVPTAPGPSQDEDGITFGGGLSDLSLDDLQALLGQMDSVRALPSSNPESMTPVIALQEGGKTL